MRAKNCVEPVVPSSSAGPLLVAGVVCRPHFGGEDGIQYYIK